jgi:chromosome segregation ATPase
MSDAAVQQFDDFINHVRLKERTTFRIALALLFGIFLAGAIVIYMSIASLSGKIAGYEEAISKAEGKTQALSAKVSEEQTKLATIPANVSSINQAQAKMIAALENQRKDIDALKAEMSTLKSEANRPRRPPAQP